MDRNDIIRRHMSQLYDEIWEHFDSTRYSPWPEVLDFIEKSEGEFAVDLASGNGRHAPALMGRGFRVCCVDLCVPLLRSAGNRMESHGNDGHILRADATAIPLADGSADIVLFIAGLHHLPSPKTRKRSLTEVGRVLKPGGRALVSAWSVDQTSIPAENMRRSLETPWGPVALDGNDWFIPWKADGTPRYRYYHLFSVDELDDAVGEVFRRRNTFVSGNNVFSVIER